MGMRVATAIMRSTGSITSTRRLACVGLLLLGLGACASTPKYADSLTPPLSRLDVTSTFGQRTASRPHYGIDLAASKGTKVMAAADGKVVFAGKQRGFGKIVMRKGCLNRAMGEERFIDQHYLVTKTGDAA